MEKMSPRTFLIGLGATVGVVFLYVGGLSLWVRSQTTYYVEAYRVARNVESGNAERLRERFFFKDFDACSLEIEWSTIAWSTYDNRDIKVGPYKLFVFVDPRVADLKSVEIVSVDIKSSHGTQYSLPGTDDAVLSIKLDEKRAKRYGKVDQPLAFDFANGEEIVTVITVRFNRAETAETHGFEVHWKPVLVRY